eukprot:GEZU01008298.1.p2 GENE.GEZU01008298.1~~GEZU01008298.1.p2  ORF type:complete len:145 (+),score=39.43 GEZU01008298.1:314-748(+)
MSDNRKEKEIMLPQNSVDINNERDGLRVKEAVANSEKQTNAVTSTAVSVLIDTDNNDALVDAPAAAAAAPGVKKSPLKKTHVNRCFCCQKKTGLSGFKCRCGENFCPTHRYPEKHNCTFDFQGMGRDILAKQNPLVKTAKVDAI